MRIWAWLQAGDLPPGGGVQVRPLGPLADPGGHPGDRPSCCAPAACVNVSPPVLPAPCIHPPIAAVRQPAGARLPVERLLQLQAAHWHARCTSRQCCTRSWAQLRRSCASQAAHSRRCASTPRRFRQPHGRQRQDRLAPVGLAPGARGRRAPAGQLAAGTLAGWWVLATGIWQRGWVPERHPLGRLLTGPPPAHALQRPLAFPRACCPAAGCAGRLCPAPPQVGGCGIASGCLRSRKTAGQDRLHPWKGHCT